MTHRDEDREAPRPYTTYKAGRGRRSRIDEELAGVRTESGSGSGARGSGATARDPLSASPRRRRRRWWHIPAALLAVLAIAAVVLIVLAWPGYHAFDRAVDKSNRRIDAKTRAQLDPDDGWLWRSGTTIALFGLDDAWLQAHSDTVMLLRFDPKTRSVNQLSIPRDTLVTVDGYGQTKLTEAMWFGGPSLALKTVRQYMDIPINHVVVVGFQGFPRLVNSVGGVDFYVPETVTTTAGSNARPVTFEKGMHHFDGKNAMLYVRIRKAYSGGDFTRAARQQAFLQALQKKLMRPSNIRQLPTIGRHFMSGVATDLTTNQILELALLKWASSDGKRLVMKGAVSSYNGQSVVLPPSESAKRRMINRFLSE